MWKREGIKWYSKKYKKVPRGVDGWNKGAKMGLGQTSLKVAFATFATCKLIVAPKIS